jgi:hypothetical protein
MLRFPYYKGRPHIPLVLEYGNRQERSLPLLDTGADFSIFHRSVSDSLGLDPAQGTLRQFNNADGSIFEVCEFRLSVEIAGARFPARICFADQSALAEFPLLGRLDIFEKFRVTVCEQDQYVELVPTGTSF